MLKENNYYLTHHKGKKAFGLRNLFAQIKSSFLRISEKIYNDDDNFTVSLGRAWANSWQLTKNSLHLP